MKAKRTPQGHKLTDLILEILRVRGSLERHGVKLTQPFGQTPARWQVMAAAWGDTRTVPQIARRMGLTRQNVQRIADVLVREGLTTFVINPDHQRSPILQLTDQGVETIQGITREQLRWSNQLGREIELKDLEVTLRTLQKLIRLLDEKS